MSRFPILALLIACSEYDINKGKDPVAVSDDTGEPAEDTDTEDPGDPALELDPSAVDLGTVCGGGVSEITLSSTGEADLTVAALTVVGSGWTLGEVELPAILPPGESLVVPLSTSGGEGMLLVETDAPGQESIEVPLDAVFDVAPVIGITAPLGDSVLTAGAITRFGGQVSDDHDLATELAISWVSDVDGLVSDAPADVDGLLGFDWNAVDRSSGAHTVTVTATDSCGNSASDSVVFCQNEGYIEDSLDLATWHFEGSALWDATNGWVELTQPLLTQAGAAFQTSTTVDSTNVVIELSFYVSGGTGADGISLTALDTSRMTTYVGDAGGGIGYGGLPGWSLEIDTWWNGEYYEPTTEDHLSLHIDGNAAAPVTWAALPEMEDGAWHQAAVTVSGTWIKVEVDGTTYIDQAVPELVSFPAYVGFTGATGAVTNYHLIDALQVQRYVCED